MTEPRRILDADGVPIAKPPKRHEAVFEWIRKRIVTPKAILLWVIAAIASTAGVVTNLDKIRGAIFPKEVAESPKALPPSKVNVVEPKNVETPPPAPPTYTPDQLSVLPRPTTEARQSQQFEATSIVIVNTLSSPIRVAFSYPPNPEDTSSIREAQFLRIVTPTIKSNTTFEHHEKSFGGGVYIAVLFKGKWEKVPLWHDLQVQFSRKVVVSEKDDRLDVTVEF